MCEITLLHSAGKARAFIVVIPNLLSLQQNAKHMMTIRVRPHITRVAVSHRPPTLNIKSRFASLPSLFPSHINFEQE